MELTPWDYWRQTADPALDGDGGSGNNALNDCGPECLSMVAAYLTGAMLDADYIKDCIKGPSYVGYTSLADLALWLKKFLRTDSQILFPSSCEEWLYHIWKCLTLEHPIIGLFSFSGPGASDGHFRCIVGMSSDRDTPDGGSLITADPATGTRRVETWDGLYSWAKGPIIHVQRRRSVLV